MDKLIQYLKNVRSEMAKVSWPTKDDITGATILVVVLSVVVSIYVYACDQLLNYVLGFFLRM
jgi:preprotein translocase subunit SecE